MIDEERILKNRLCYLKDPETPSLSTRYFNSEVDNELESGWKCTGHATQDSLSERICIPFPLVCDGKEHCADGSDEDESIGCGLHRGNFHV